MSGTMAIRTVAAAAAALALVLYAADGSAIDPRQGAATEPGPKLIPTGPAKSACLSFHFGIADIDLKPEDWGRARGRQTIGRLFALAFDAIDTAKGDEALKGAKVAFDLAKGMRGGTNPWYFEAGFRLIYATVCNPLWE